MLLFRAQSALENWQSDNYVEDYLAKIPTDLHDKLHRMVMFGACFIVIFFKVRRGREWLESLMLTDFKLVEDETFNFRIETKPNLSHLKKVFPSRYFKKFRLENNKKHKNMGTNIAYSGVIPFVDVLLEDGITMFNPGQFFQFYTSLVPTEATKEGCKGGFLFQRGKKHGFGGFNLHDPTTANLYKPNIKDESLKHN